ncbi:speckle targeted PIP5K1A-regulated poly(A) polymerase-like isoform X2 [Tachypleus tridentatus]|uniref:speckle targeted PIP5K1A-regulated poly(A) polymerase-like isoform X2 n=1 Tax=Tachypleus tridentatus TaxID=6853 RepID=UPI003FD09EAD
MNQEICHICNVFLPPGPSKEKNTHYNGKKHKANLAKRQQEEEAAKRTLYVTGFHPNTEVEELHDFFSFLGDVEQVTIDSEKRKFAFVEFKEERSVTKALYRRRPLVLHRHQLLVKRRQLKLLTDPDGGEEFQISETAAAAAQPVEHNVVVAKLLRVETVELQMVLLKNVLELDREEEFKRHNFCRILQDALHEFFPGCIVHIYGSSVNGFGFKGCDIDIFLDIRHLLRKEFFPCMPITMDDDDIPSIYEIRDGLVPLGALLDLPKDLMMKFIVQVIRNIPRCRNVIFIPSKHHSIVHFLHFGLGLNCDLSCSASLDVQNSRLLALYCDLDPRVQSLTMTLLYWSKMSELVGTGDNLSYYAFIWLVIFFLQTRNPPVVPTVLELRQLADEVREVDGIDSTFCDDPSKICPSANLLPADELLKDFFSFYSSFNFRQWVICPRFGQVIKKQEFFHTFPYLAHFRITPLSIQDSFDLNCNITASVSDNALESLLASFHKAQLLCNSPCYTGECKGAPKSWGILALLDPKKHLHAQPKPPVPEQKQDLIPETKVVAEKFIIEFQTQFLNFCFGLLSQNVSEWNMEKLWMYKTSYIILEILQRGMMFECKVRDYMRRRWMKKKDDECAQKGVELSNNQGKRKQLSPESEETSSKRLCVNQEKELDKETENSVPKEDKNILYDPENPTEWDQFEELIFGLQVNHDTDKDWDEEDSDKEADDNPEEIQSSSGVTSESQPSTSSDKHSTGSRTLLKIFSKVFYRTWSGRKKYKAGFDPKKPNDPLEIEEYISENIISKSSQKPEKPLFEFICRTKELNKNGMLSIEVELKPKTPSKEFTGHVSVFLSSYLSKMAEKLMLAGNT